MWIRTYSHVMRFSAPRDESKKEVKVIHSCITIQEDDHTLGFLFRAYQYRETIQFVFFEGDDSECFGIIGNRF